MTYFTSCKNLFINNGHLKEGEGEKRHTQISGTSLILKHCHGNVGHFINDHYYSFYALATRGQSLGASSYDQILIPGGASPNHSFLAINCLPLSLKEKVVFLEKNVSYCAQKAIIGCADRKLSFRENQKTLIPEMRANFIKNSGTHENPIDRGVFIYQNTYPENTVTYGRRILNLTAVEDALKQQGLKPYCAQGYTWFTENSPHFIFNKLFSFNSFLGPWGAWLCNLLFAPSKSSIRALIHPQNFQSWYQDTPLGVNWSQQYLHEHELGNTFSFLHPTCVAPTEAPPPHLSRRMKEPEIICDFNLELKHL
jgi:hypothetical protein